MKVEKIEKPQDFSIGQLYMYKEYGDKLLRGYCRKIEEEYVTITDMRYSWTSDKRLKIGEDVVYLYNSSLFNKYQKLLEQQEKERTELLEGKPIVVDEIVQKRNKKRWLKWLHRK